MGDIRDNYVNSNPEIMKYSAKLLRFHQIWLPKNLEVPNLLYKLKFSSCLLAGIVLFMLIFMSAVNAFRYNALEVINEFIAYLASLSAGMYVFVMAVNAKSKMSRIIKDIVNFEDFGKPENLEDTTKYLNMFILVNYSYVMLAFFVQSVYGIWMMDRCDQEYAEEGYQVVCGFLETMLLIDGNRSTIRWSLFLYSFLSSFVIMSSSALTNIVFYEINMYFIVKIKHLNKKLEKMFDEEYEGSYHESFKNGVRYHIHVMRLGKELNECFRNVTAVHALLAGVIFSLLGNLITLKQKLPDVFHLGGWVYLTFMLCYTGQMITNESECISVAIYNSRWYRVSPNLQRDIVLMLKESQKPLVLNGGPFLVLSFPLFQVIVKSAYSYLAFIQSARE